MPDLQELQEKIKAVAESAFNEIKEFDREGIDLAHLLMDSELQNDQIEIDHMIVRHISISKEDIDSRIANYKDAHPENKGLYPMPQSLLNRFCEELYVEAMPKVNANEINLSYIDTLKILHKSLHSLGKFHYDEIYLAFSKWNDVIFYRNRTDIVRPFVIKDKNGFGSASVVIAESKKDEDFKYPSFGRYSGPSMIFKPFDAYTTPDIRTRASYSFSVLENMYNEIKKPK